MIRFLRVLPLMYCLSGWAAEPQLDPKELPRIPATEPAQALKTFEIMPGFHLELVAAEPLVLDPIAVSFDERGRMFVVEMRDYAERRGERLGRVRMLEDTDGDGIYDKSTVYVDNLPWPTAVICYDGGIFVGATPDILYCKDTKGDGRADVREVVFTGFGNEFAPYDPLQLNVQQLFNSFTWGLDNRIHGASGGNGGRVAALRHPTDELVDLRGRDFSFDPKELRIRAETDGGQYGLAFDDAGRKFVCSNSSHIRQVLYELRYAQMNRFYTPPPPSIDIAVEGPAAEIFRISPDEPWRVVRTRWRVAGLVSGPIEGGGRPSGYFSAATGIMIYRGDAWPEAYRGEAFVADCGGNLVHRKKLWSEGGIGMKAARPDEEKKKEFLASRDNWFRPVQLANAPDGNLYVIDMYREVIEHPWSLPESIKKHLDLNSGNNRGRIYRIAPDGWRPVAKRTLGEMSPREWVAALESANGWTRDTAARLIFQKHDRSAGDDVRQLLRSSPSKLARLHALFVLDGLGVLADEDLFKGLKDSAPEVRWNAIRLAERNLRERLAGELGKRLISMGGDSDPEVRYQAVLTAGLAGLPGKEALLEEVAAKDAENEWSRAAILMASGHGASDLLLRLAREEESSAKAGVRSLMVKLCELVGVAQDQDGISKVLQRASERRRNDGIVWAAAVERGLERSGKSLKTFSGGPGFETIRVEAVKLFADDRAGIEQRSAALRVLESTSGPGLGEVLEEALAPRQPEAIQRASVEALIRAGQIARLINRWSALSPGLRGRAIELAMQRTDRTVALLRAAEAGKVGAGDFSIPQRALLRESSSTEVRQLGERVFGARSADESRQKVVQRFLPCLALLGNPIHGREIFLQRCASCHSVHGQGKALGPDLSTVIQSGKEAILTSILDPNREVNSRYLQYSVEQDDGEQWDGIILSENNQSVVLGMPNGGRAEVLRHRIRKFQARGKSLMPEGLEEGLGLQDLADLIEWITGGEKGGKRP